MNWAKNMELTNVGKEMVAKIFQGLILFLFFQSVWFLSNSPAFLPDFLSS